MTTTIETYLLEGCGRCSLGGTPQCKVHTWSKELKALRSIVLDCGLTETVKWGVPCYTHGKANVAIVAAFKNYASISFFKGALLSDADKLLTAPGDNSQATRQIRFTSVKDIVKHEQEIRNYIFEAIEIEKAGLKVDFKAKPAPEYPEELTAIFKKKPTFKKAFESLTPGRQRGYLLFFSQAKQSATKISRIEKYLPKIMDGKGMMD